MNYLLKKLERLDESNSDVLLSSPVRFSRLSDAELAVRGDPPGFESDDGSALTETVKNYKLNAVKFPVPLLSDCSTHDQN